MSEGKPRRGFPERTTAVTTPPTEEGKGPKAPSLPREATPPSREERQEEGPGDAVAFRRRRMPSRFARQPSEASRPACWPEPEAEESGRGCGGGLLPHST